MEGVWADFHFPPKGDTSLPCALERADMPGCCGVEADQGQPPTALGQGCSPAPDCFRHLQAVTLPAAETQYGG